MKFLSEFKKFAIRGNAVDLAIGVVIGAAFTTLVNAIVSSFFEPLISLVNSSLDFKNLKWVLRAATENTSEVAITYGQVLSAIMNFVIIALICFIAIKAINKLSDQNASKVEAPKSSEEAILLQEILTALQSSDRK